MRSLPGKEEARGIAAGLVVILGVASGCVNMTSLSTHDAPPIGGAAQVVATWKREVIFTPDPAHNGTPIPGLAGRVYLFGETVDYPLAGDGALVVDLYLDSAKPGAPTTPPVEEWRFDPATLKRLSRRDAIGWGYTLFLPWGTYKPEIDHVHLKLRYEPPTGYPLYGDSGPLTLAHADSGSSAPTVSVVHDMGNKPGQAVLKSPPPNAAAPTAQAK
jgi:hypothetical protein